MLFRNAGHDRGVEMGPYPLDALAKESMPGAALAAYLADKPAATTLPDIDSSLGQAVTKYANILANCANQPSAAIGEGTTDLALRKREIKGAAYYLDAAHVGVCVIPQQAWLDAPSDHTHAVVIWVQTGLDIEQNNLAYKWVSGSESHIAHMRALEIGVSITGHIRALGFSASCNYCDSSEVDQDLLAIQAGVAICANNQVISPFFGHQYTGVVITTDYAMAVDTPLHVDAEVPRLKYWWGTQWRYFGTRAQSSSQACLPHVTLPHGTSKASSRANNVNFR